MNEQLEKLHSALENVRNSISKEELLELIELATSLSDSYDKKIRKCKKNGNYDEMKLLMDQQRVITDVYWRLKHLLDYEQLQQRLRNLINTKG
jgi:predicted RNA-binding protein